VGPSEDQQFPIVKGKIEGGKITIEGSQQESVAAADFRRFSIGAAVGRL
jgi:hypothetical protein